MAVKAPLPFPAKPGKGRSPIGAGAQVDGAPSDEPEADGEPPMGEDVSSDAGLLPNRNPALVGVKPWGGRKIGKSPSGVLRR